MTMQDLPHIAADVLETPSLAKLAPAGRLHPSATLTDPVWLPAPVHLASSSDA
jgi:hypothetical protein